jgi:hypothetical protein
LASAKVPTAVGVAEFAVDAYATLAVLPTSVLAPVSSTVTVVAMPCDTAGADTDRTAVGSRYAGAPALRTTGPRTPLGVSTRMNTVTCSLASAGAVSDTLAEPVELRGAVTAVVARARDSVAPMYTEHCAPESPGAGVTVTVALTATPIVRIGETVSAVGYVNPAAPSTRNDPTARVVEKLIADGAESSSTRGHTPRVGVTENPTVPVVVLYVRPVAVVAPIVIFMLAAVKLATFGPVSVTEPVAAVASTSDGTLDEATVGNS